jgi:hypothetical protein
MQGPGGQVLRRFADVSARCRNVYFQTIIPHFVNYEEWKCWHKVNAIRANMISTSEEKMRILSSRVLKSSAICFIALSTARAEENLAGTVKTLRGNAVILRGGASIPIQPGQHVLINDSLRTDTDGALGVILQDGTRLSLGPGTELKVDRFVYQPSDGRFALLLQLARGAMAYVSGKIAQFSPGSATVETPVGILGLRGTEFVVSLAGK